MNRRALLWLGALVFAAVEPASAQEPNATAQPLEVFVNEVARRWNDADVAGLIQLLPEEDQIVLDTGTGIENATGRHAAAALRALFSENQTLAARPVRVTVASARPPRGFGELDWTFRARGAPGELSRSIYVGASWEVDRWRITELRVMP